MGAMQHALRYSNMPNSAWPLVYENSDVGESFTTPHVRVKDVLRRNCSGYHMKRRGRDVGELDHPDPKGRHCDKRECIRKDIGGDFSRNFLVI
jgi:hypothetical protein